jgi:GNAT superfamily N-acetyltransferase
MRIRPFQTADAARICEIFYRSVHEVAGAKYDRAQVDAWAPEVPEPERWLARLNSFHTFVADDDAGTTVAWIAMRDDGYIDMLYCLPEATRCGVAAKLYATVEEIAIARGIARLTAHASLLAQPFFRKQGWVIEKHEVVVRNGVELPRAEMSKRLTRDDAQFGTDPSGLLTTAKQNGS